MKTVQHGTNLAKTLGHRVSERTAASHDHGGFPIRLARCALALAHAALSPAALRLRLALVHRHRHWDHQGHYGGGGIFLQRVQKEDKERREQETPRSEKWREIFKK